MTTELSVKDGNRVIERDERGNVVSDKDYVRVQAGYKAAAHNESLTEATRKHAESMLHDLEAQHGQVGSGGSEEHKRADDELVEEGSVHAGGAGATLAQTHEEMVHQHRIIGGLKANLHRSDRSDETKEEIKQKLRDMGADES
ncbi:hypothetical protein JCM3774_003872 [Rhodotorula dairenensis]